MSLQAKILSLLADITDPTTRMDIASTLYYLCDLYSAGQVKEDELRGYLTDIIRDVISAVYPELSDEEVKAKTGEMVEEFIRLFKLETIRRRTFARMRGLPSGVI